MDNAFTRLERERPLSGEFCNKKIGMCENSISEEEAWQRLQCYIECHGYDWTYDRIKNDYRKYYLKGSYCSHTLIDIIKQNENECKLLFSHLEA